MTDEDFERWRMGYNQKANRLAEVVKARLAEINLTPTKAARSVGLPSGFITDILSGRKASVQGRNFERLAEALQWSPADLVGFGSAKPGRYDFEPQDNIPLLGDIAPGIWVDTRTTSDPEDYLPYELVYKSFQPLNVFDVTVKGTSLNKFALEGQRLRCIKNVEEDNYLPPNEIFILQRDNGFLRERSAMQLIDQRDGKRRFEFLSTDQKWRKELITSSDGDSDDGTYTVIGMATLVYRDL